MDHQGHQMQHCVIAGSLAMDILLQKGPTKNNFTLLPMPCVPDSRRPKAVTTECPGTEEQTKCSTNTLQAMLCCASSSSGGIKWAKTPRNLKDWSMPQKYRGGEKTQPDYSRSCHADQREKCPPDPTRMTNRQSET